MQNQHNLKTNFPNGSKAVGVGEKDKGENNFRNRQSKYYFK